MASNVLLIGLFVLVCFSLSSAYSLSTKDVLSKQDDESSYVMATNDQGSPMTVVEDLVKSRSLQALVASSKVAVNKASSKSKKKKSSKKKKNKKKKNAGAIGGIIAAAIVVTIFIILIIYLYKRKHETKKAESIKQEKIKMSSGTQPSKTETHV